MIRQLRRRRYCLLAGLGGKSLSAPPAEARRQGGSFFSRRKKAPLGGAEAGRFPPEGEKLYFQVGQWLTSSGILVSLFHRWAIVQLAGRRILAPIIKVRVLVAQPQQNMSPSSSRPRTAAFHAVNGGSNPPGDAKNFNRLQQLSFWVTKIGLQFFLRRPSLEEFLF